uniref:Fucosyltransferase n=1 Tax=Phallusia mammillata TaxID=59560 RepID=A0A6F9DCM0_9ASCI|nr:alpha-(1,3)-fucosyltransferase 9-like [Phallusia mammillata]
MDAPSDLKLRVAALLTARKIRNLNFTVIVLNVALIVFVFLMLDQGPPILRMSRKSEEAIDITDRELKAALARSNEKLTILLMYPERWDANNVMRLPYHCGNCEVSLDKSKVENPSTKALVFNFNDPIKEIAPQTRRRDQYYVWITAESPVALYHLRKMDLKGFDDFFNLTMSYRRDSDVYSPYGTHQQLRSYRKDLPFSDAELDTWVKSKSKVALWVASNCHATKHAVARKDYVMELIKAGLDVELGGKCFQNSAANFRNHKFKFYLAFENAWHCRDYITEKFWHSGLRSGVVPVVLGPPKRDYETIAPSPKSFIYAGDFPTPRHLAEYLNYLDKNDSAYKEYLNWMKTDRKEVKERDRVTGFCQLCRILHGINVDNVYNPDYKAKYKHIPLYQRPEGPRIVYSLNEWFYGSDYKECLGVSGLET